MDHDLDLPRNHANGANGASARGAQDDRLDSWKKIASHLRRDVSTVQRWERREGMPVHRHLHDKQGSVFAFRSELDAWWESRRARLTQDNSDQNEPPAAILPTARSGRPYRRPYKWVLTLVLAVALIAGALAWYAARAGYFWSNPLADAHFTRVMDFAGTEQAAAISRDGKYLAFLSERDGQMDAWISEVGSGNYRNLTHGELRELVNPSIRTLDFSADSSLVTVWTRQSDGSQPDDVRILAAPTAGGPLQPYLAAAAELDWSHDGKQLVFHTTAPGDPLFVRPAGLTGTATDRQIYAAPAGVHCHFPVWSPDDAFIYFVRGVPPDDWDIWRIQPSGAGLDRITTHKSQVSYPVMLDRRTLAYLATEADGSGPWIYAVDVERRIPHRISSGLESFSSLAATANGARLVATVANSHTSVWRMPVTKAHVMTAAASPSLLAANGLTPRLGPGYLLYVSWRGDRQGIWALARGITREIWSSASARILGGPAISPDGRRIAFSVDDGGRTLLYVIDSDASHMRTLSDSLVLRGNPAWAPDGRSVVTAAATNGEPRLMRISLNGDAPVSLVAEYSMDPVWSPDGRFMVYSGADVGTTFPLRAAAADGRPYPLPSLILTRGARRVAFFRDPQTLLILSGDILHKNFWLFDLRTGVQRPLAQLPAEFDIRDFDVSGDGSEIVFDRSQVNEDLALIERAH
jgi:Tol biopolymer transport system component